MTRRQRQPKRGGFTVHDVRHLALCPVCGNIGLDWAMIRESWDSGHWFHGRCFVERFGIDALLKRAGPDTGGLTLDDLGFDNMKRLVDHIASKSLPESAP